MRLIQLYYCFAFFLFSKQSFAQRIENIIKNDSIHQFVSISGFLSKDTIAVIYYKKDKWYKATSLKPYSLLSTTNCDQCSEFFNPSFLKKIFSLNTEKENSEDCAKINDTIINGEKVSKYINFYYQSDLVPETIMIKNGHRSKLISFLEPRRALKVCTNNSNRLKFIDMVNLLRNIK